MDIAFDDHLLAFPGRLEIHAFLLAFIYEVGQIDGLQILEGADRLLEGVRVQGLLYLPVVRVPVLVPLAEAYYLRQLLF
jgi:hypothetical protein